MYDISINKNGSILLYEGDLQQVSYERYVAQRIHVAIMNIPSGLLTIGSTTQKDNYTKVFTQYFYDYFAGDRNIEPYGISVISNSIDTTDTVASYEINYEAESPEGKIINYKSNFDFNISGGVVSNLDYRRKSYGINTKDIMEVTDFIVINEITNRVELPVTPFKALDSDQIISPVAILEIENESDEEINSTFEIDAGNIKQTYQLDNYVDNIDFTKHIIQRIDNIEVEPEETDIYVYNKNGKILIRVNSPCTIIGSVILSSAKHLTYDILYSDTPIDNIVYPLRPIGGKCYAVFPTTILPGTYILRYAGES